MGRYRSIKILYANVLLHVNYNNTISTAIRSQVGIKQGERLSPLLFVLSVNDYLSYWLLILFVFTIIVILFILLVDLARSSLQRFIININDTRPLIGKGMFYLTTHSTHFILQLYGVIHTVKDHFTGYSFRLTARGLYAPSHRQGCTYHGLCYTSRGALAGTRNSSMGPPHEGSIRRPIAPWANALSKELHLAPGSGRSAP